MLSVFYAECHIQALYAECHYSDCPYAKCLAESRGAVLLSAVIMNFLTRLGTPYHYNTSPFGCLKFLKNEISKFKFPQIAEIGANQSINFNAILLWVKHF